MRALSALINSQRALSDLLDSKLPSHFRVDGHQQYRAEFAPQYFRRGIEVWDIGGGKCPLIDAATKNRLSIHYVGLDISSSELSSAPPGIYDETFVADISDFTGRKTADLIVCQAVLEHVPDAYAALGSFTTILKPGGIAAIFVPARNALSARLNLMIPERVKQKLLSTFWPELDGRQGYRAYYNRCTAPAFHVMASQYGLELLQECFFHQCGYFRIMFPAHLLWRLWILLGYRLDRALWAESFSMALREPMERSTDVQPGGPLSKKGATRQVELAGI